MAELHSDREYAGGEEERRHIEEANRIANAGNTPRRMQAEVVVEEEPITEASPPGGHLSPSVRDAVLDENLDLPVSVGSLR